MEMARGASSSGRGRGSVIVSLISCRRQSEDEDEGTSSFSVREGMSSEGKGNREGTSSSSRA